MKTHNGPLWRGLYFALLFVALAYVVSGTTSGSKVSSATKQLKRQFNDDLLQSSASKQEATRQLSAPAAAASNPSEKSNQQKQQEQQSAIPSEQPAQVAQSSAQPAAEKKQGDSAAQDIFSSDEYVQIKPEEITVNENGKEIAPASSETAAATNQQQQSDQQTAPAAGEQQQIANGAEHKSADDELNAHLALDSISQQESAAYHSYSPLMQSRPQAPVQRAAGYPPQPDPYKVAPRPLPAAAGYQPPAPAQRGPRSPPRLPPSYITLKGKLTGINSIISQYPHPAPGYPHQGPRHLPRGAAAGYAAFRDFVRAHASKYKHAGSGPQQPQMPVTGGYGGEQPRGYERPKEIAVGYNQAPKAAHMQLTPYEPRGQTKRAPMKTKVTVAQAYIPNLSAPAPASYGAGQSGAASAGYTNPVLAKLYGGHAPQGIGKPEYSKDYGMVIHYPQATVYTEPMTVDQLHKLTGAGISQVLEQLQYNFAHGQRDESNTLRANNKHHIGNGVTIHAKEYYAPGKSGHYVPTTAAVISTSSQQSAYGGRPAYEDTQAASYEGPASEYNGAQKAVELGAGYERVRQAASSGQQKYNNKHTNHAVANEYPQQQQPQQQYSAAPAGSYEQTSGSRYGNGEPLSAITSFIGSELEALYKANAALTKHIEPEIYSQIQAYKNTGKANAPLRYSEIQQRPYAGANGAGYGVQAAGPAPYPGQQVGGGQFSASGAQLGANKYTNQQHQQRGRAGYPRRPNGAAKGNRHYRQSQRPPNPYSNRQPIQQGYGNRPQQVQVSSHQQQAAAYKATEQALEQQMMQLLQDFRTGDEHYNSKSQPSHAINQGYPNKVMQKYNQQHQQYQQAAYANQQHPQQQASAYAHHDGLEIPQGPNDQIGEIADLIEALKGSLDLQKPEQASDSYGAPKQAARQLEDVRYLTSALGQAPSYAIQVPVANGESASYESSGKKGADNGYQQQQHHVAAPAAYSKQPQASGPAYQSGGSDGGYGAPINQAPAQSYSGPAQQAVGAPSYQQQQQPASSYGPAQPQEPSGYQQQPQQSEYQQQQHQHQQQHQPDYQQATQAEYGASGQHQHQQVEPASQSGYAQPAAAAPAEQQPASGYEHSQVINHLVPVTTSSVAASQPAQSGYAQAGPSHPPQATVSQIAIAAPTESQYQQAQSLSSFVDSLATDYQELLRQPSPALLDATSGAAAQLAVPASQDSSSSSYVSNATAPAEGNYDNAASASQQVASSTSSQTTGGQQAVYQQQQQQQPAQTKSHSSASGSSAGQQQYKKAAA